MRLLGKRRVLVPLALLLGALLGVKNTEQLVATGEVIVQAVQGHSPK